jgi:hypothetical protein
MTMTEIITNQPTFIGKTENATTTETGGCHNTCCFCNCCHHKCEKCKQNRDDCCSGGCSNDNCGNNFWLGYWLGSSDDNSDGECCADCCDCDCFNSCGDCELPDLG